MVGSRARCAACLGIHAAFRVWDAAQAAHQFSFQAGAATVKPPAVAYHENSCNQSAVSCADMQAHLWASALRVMAESYACHSGCTACLGMQQQQHAAQQALLAPHSPHVVSACICNALAMDAAASWLGVRQHLLSTVVTRAGQTLNLLFLQAQLAHHSISC